MKRSKIQELQALVEDMYWEYDRVSSSGQKTLDKDPQIILDTIHSCKGSEADNVLLFSKTNWISSFHNKNLQEKSEERKVYYVGVTRAKKRLHLLGTDHRYNYPMGVDYLDYLREKK